MLALLRNYLVGVGALIKFFDEIFVRREKVFNFLEKNAAEFFDVHLLGDLDHWLIVHCPDCFCERNWIQIFLT